MGVDWDDNEAIKAELARQASGEAKASDFYYIGTNPAKDTVDWAPKDAEGSCVQKGDPIGRVQIGGTFHEVDSGQDIVYLGKGGKYQNAAVKWFGRLVGSQ